MKTKIEMYVVFPNREKLVPAGILEVDSYSEENIQNIFEHLKKNNYIDNDLEEDEIFIEPDLYHCILSVYNDDNELILYGEEK